MRFIFEVNGSYEPIENIKPKKRLDGRISEGQVMRALDLASDHAVCFHVDEQTYPLFRDFGTIGTHPNCDIVLVNDANVDSMAGKALKNAYLFVQDELRLFENFQKVCDGVEGFIELKMRELSAYDLAVLGDQVQKVCDALYERDKADGRLIVKQLNGYRVREKFQGWGETDLFVGLDSRIYCHPNFYYDADPRGVVGTLDGSPIAEITTHFTIPHLVCINCECFWCDRGIYLNKLRTGEFKVPSRNSDAATTFFSKYSKGLFNRLMDERAFDPDEDLDKAESFEPDAAYDKFKSARTLANTVKGIGRAYSWRGFAGDK